MAEAKLHANLCVCHVCKSQFEKRRGHNIYCGERCRRYVEHVRRTEVRRADGVKKTGAAFRCARCNEETVFRGRRSLYCAPCVKVRRKETLAAYRERNPEKVRAFQRQNHERRKDNPAYMQWKKDYSREATRKRRKNPRHRLDHRMGQLVRNGLNGTKNGRTWESLVGYTIDDLFAHLERQFLKGMSWANMAEWHVDHILPKALFEYSSPEDADFKACWALSNLRPLWSEENIKKGANRLHLI